MHNLDGHVDALLGGRHCAEVAGTPVGLLHGCETVQIEKPVEVAEGDGDRNEDHVLWVASEVWDVLHNLAGKDEHCEEDVGQEGKTSTTNESVESEPHHALPDDSGSEEGAEVDHIGAPEHLARAPVLLVLHDGEVAAPVCASPAEALVEVLHASLDGGLKHCIRVELNGDLPAESVDVASQTLVVIAVQWHATPAVIQEVVPELVGLEDLGAIGSSAAREGGDGSIDSCNGGDMVSMCIGLRDSRESLPLVVALFQVRRSR